MGINEESLKNLFSYHPPVSESRKQKHEVVNQASVDFAIALSQIINNPAELTTILRKVQEVRMMANQSITYDDLGISYRGIFETE